MSNNYSEQIFQSIDTIISQRLNEVSFDKTEICEIISQDENNKQKYWVTNGGLKFEAYSIDENKKYIENQKVYVTIPQGNYALRKLIIGSYSADETNENLYVNPFDHFVVNSKYKLINENNCLIAEARKDGKMYQSQPFTTNDLIFYPSGLEDFNYIGIDFSATTGFGGTNGEFQIIIDLCGRKEKPNGGYEYFSLLSEEELGLLTFSSKQLYGNPYYLNDTLSFQHLFNFPVGSFSDVTKIKQIKVTLVTKGDFNYNGDQIQNVIINNLTLYLGFKTSSEKLETDRLIISNINNTTSIYSFDDLSEKEIRLEWYSNQDKIVYNDNQPYIELEKHQIYWCKYIFGYEKTENDIEQSGPYWKVVQSGDAADASSYLYSLSPNTDLASEQIKVILIEKTNNENWLVSNGLTYENLKPDTVTSIQNELEDLLLTVPTGLIYNIYGENNQLLSNTQENKQVSVEYLDNTVWDSSKQKVTWKIPKISSLLLPSEDEENPWIEEENFYVKTFEKQETNIPDYGKMINFNFKNGYDYNYINNTIRCDIIRYDGDTPTYSHFGTTTLQFGLAGTSGSQFNLNIYPENGEYFIRTYANGHENPYYKLKAVLTGPDNKKINNVDYNNLTWSWYSQRGIQNNPEKDPKKYWQYEIVEEEKRGQTISIKRYAHRADVYAIIQAVYEHKIDNKNTIKLIAYFPIATNSDYNKNYILQGATRIVYNFQGTTPQYNEVPYKIYDKITGKEVDATKTWEWEIWTEDTENWSETYQPFALSENNVLIVPSLFPTNPPKVSIVARNPEIWVTDENGNSSKKIEYIQPILVIKNGYSSALINEWDGQLKINNENNTIFSSLIGAGVKNRNNNTFTGVLMGAVGDTIKNAKTGLYGFQNGTERFSFTEKGSAYIGTGSDNFISFNEGNSRSESGELKIQTKSFVLNTEKLTIDSTVWGENPVIKFSDKFELRANGTATIGGWNIGANEFGTGNVHGGGTGIIISTEHGILARKSTGTSNTEYVDTFHLDTKGNAYFAGDITGSKGTFKGDINTAGNISVSGKLNVTGTGTIAGWTINTDSLQSVVGNVGNIRINSNQSESKNWIEITQTASFSDAIFKITKNGILHASGAVINGSGTFTGTIEADNGYIGGWTIGNGGGIYFNNGNGGCGLWGTTAHANIAIHAGGNSANIGGAPFRVYHDGRLFATEATITGRLEAGSILGSGFKIVNNGNMGSAGLQVGTFGVGASAVSFEKEYLSAQYRGDTVEDARWYAVVFAANEWENGSDKRLKNSINDFNEKYDSFFNSLHPVTFKYNNGRSGRIHSGFIAQEVVASLEESGLSTMDFAAPCLLNYNTDNEGYWWLRRDQFIALNTWQIQKLKTRVTELENEIKEIKQRYEI